MPIRIQGGPAMGVVVDSSGARAEGGAAIPVAVVTDGRVQSAGKATRVVVVTNPDHIEGGPAIPVVAAAAGDPVEGGPAMRVYVVQGSLGGGPSGPSSLLTSLVGYWKLEEASGTRVDATGRGNDVAPTNTPGNTAGRVGNAVSLAVASTQYLSRASTADVQTGAIDFTVAYWVNLTSKTATRMIVSKYSAGAAEYFTAYDQGSNRFSFVTFTPAEAVKGDVKANTFGAPSTGTWYFVVAWHDATAGTVNISVNNGAADSVLTTGNPTAGAGLFNIGAYRGGAATMDGAIDEVGVWKRKLTAAEITALYNAGAGRTYPFTGT